ncbi:hypothetical protein ABH931_006119 [Streptacidiphilus sp. MAP12-33]|uniref:hypothetical protein n=1 Tax=Streptacidiphilus sp. MAP12-33 TaxID=3156266 RepID=UPI00351622E4
MILSRYITICNGCGCLGPTSDTSRPHAQVRALADGWTTNSPGLSTVGEKHWCPACTQTRKEQP